jgi:hypothetical protein
MIPVLPFIVTIHADCYRLDEHGMNLTIRDQPIFEDENQAKQAMDEMANQLRLVSAAREA